MTGKRRRGRHGASPPVPPSPPALSSSPVGSPPAASPPAAPSRPTMPGASRDHVVAPVVVARPGRREIRQQQRRDRRRRLGAAGVLAIVVVVAGVAVGIAAGLRHVTHHAAPHPAGQSTLLISLLRPAGDAAASVLVAHDPGSHQGVELLVPSRLLTDVCGYGSQQFGRVVSLPSGARLSRTALSDVLDGVTIDGSWSLTTANLAALVDAVGGVTVDVDVDVITPGKGGTRVVQLQKGPGQHLSGAQAAQFASYVAAGEDASAGLARFQSVFEAVLDGLPHDAAAVQRLLQRVHGATAPTVGWPSTASLLAGLADDNRRSALLPTDLPVVAIDAGGDPAYRVDTTKVATFVDANLKGSLPGGVRRTRPRVLLQNGVGSPSIVPSACSRLVAAGFSLAGSGNASSFGFVTSKVLVFDDSVAAAQQGRRVADALKLPQGDVAVSSQGQNVADVLVILGKDYHP